jgi:hypothetical protein
MLHELLALILSICFISSVAIYIPIIRGGYHYSPCSEYKLIWTNLSAHSRRARLPPVPSAEAYYKIENAHNCGTSAKQCKQPPDISDDAVEGTATIPLEGSITIGNWIVIGRKSKERWRIPR